MSSITFALRSARLPQEGRDFRARWGRRCVTVLSVLGMALVLGASPVAAASRIKDIVDFEGIRENMLVGYGLVVGLDGTGDTLRKAPFTQQSLTAMLERLGVNTRSAILDTDNVAAVMVTASLPPFARQGSRVDVSVSTLGDAKSLLGGTLLVTPMLGADGEVYAVSQGAVAVAGFKAKGQGSAITKGVPTSGRIANGAIVEREVGFELSALKHMRLALKNPDFTTARRLATAINTFSGEQSAIATDPTTVSMNIPDRFRDDVVGFIGQIEQLRVEPDQRARVVIDETSGVIVMGSEVRVNTVAIAQGNLTIRVTETPQVSQPGAFSQGGTTQVVPRTNIDVNEGDGKKLVVLKPGVSLQDLVDGLNALGIGPRDMISILQAIKAAGALQAEIEVM
jgi:flagellar P-ring protein precursor FlgI